MNKPDISKASSKKVAIMYLISLGCILPSIYFFIMLAVLDDGRPDTVVSYYDYVDSATLYITCGMVLLLCGFIVLIFGMSCANSNKVTSEGSDTLIRSRYANNVPKDEAYTDCKDKFKFKESKCKKSIKKIYGEYIED
jgi:hypothetical protein